MNDLIILATLLPGPKHGYHLKREAGVIFGQGALHNNIVYPLLRRFMTKKWVSRRTVPGERGQTRHQYELTALGRKELLARLTDFTEQDARSSSAFRLRVGLFQLLSPAARTRILDLRTEFLKSRIEVISGIQTHFKLDQFAGEVTSRYCADARSELEWVRRLRNISHVAK
jgi:DNA-binding PadR family transcriptional regulator